MRSTDKVYLIGGVREGASSVSVEVISPSGEVKRLRMTKKLWDGYGFSPADTVPREVYLAMAHDSERCEAVTRAVSLLADAPHSYKALSAKLRQKGFSEEAAEAALAAVHKKGLIDEEFQARDIAEKAAKNKLRGPRRITAELQNKGYSYEVARRAADSVDESVYEHALRSVLTKKCRDGIPSEKAERDRVIASIVRLGFSPDRVINMMNTPEDE